MLLETYSPSHMKAIIKGLGLTVVGETSNDFLCLCPFHGNRHTPSFSVSHEKGLFICFNPSCGERGTIVELVRRLSPRNEYEALRFILGTQKETSEHFENDLQAVLEDKPEFQEFPQDKLDELHHNLLTSNRGKAYLSQRGIDGQSIRTFGLGYSEAQDMIIVPVHSPTGIPVGLVGRSVEGKSFKNSTGLPKNRTMFNLHRARKLSSAVVIVESSFDAIKIHQAGFPNVVAALGGTMSKYNFDNLSRNFTKFIVMTDADLAGRDLGLSIADGLKNKETLWAAYSYDTLYPHDAKDAGDMTEEEIRQCINNSLPDIEYRML
jgi:DNA primase